MGLLLEDGVEKSTSYYYGATREIVQSTQYLCAYEYVLMQHLEQIEEKHGEIETGQTE